MKVPFSYLDRQFANLEDYLADLRAFVPTGDFTLGEPLEQFQASFAKLMEAPHAIGVGTGTDAIAMSLKVLGVGPGDEVITTPNTFVATVGAIVQTGARPVFVDSTDGYVIDVTKIEAALTPSTKAIVPVHYTGNVADMPAIMVIAKRHGLHIVEDACQAIMGAIDGKLACALFGNFPLGVAVVHLPVPEHVAERVDMGRGETVILHRVDIRCAAGGVGAGLEHFVGKGR